MPFCLLACGSALKPAVGGGAKLFGTVQIHRGYCGGAAPSPEQQRGFSNPMPAAEFFIREGDGNNKSARIVAQFTTGEEGTFSVELPPGTYSVLHADKKLKLDAFKKKNAAQGSNYTSWGDECYEKWYNRADFLLNVRKDTTVVLTYRSRCFTGTNPCIRYNGPYPP